MVFVLNSLFFCSILSLALLLLTNLVVNTMVINVSMANLFAKALLVCSRDRHSLTPVLERYRCYLIDIYIYRYRYRYIKNQYAMCKIQLEILSQDQFSQTDCLFEMLESKQNTMKLINRSLRYLYYLCWTVSIKEIKEND